MDVNILLYLILLSIRSVYTTNTCRIEGLHNCVYSVICDTFSGSAQNPSCENPAVVFVIKNSLIDTLTAGFFGSTNFDSRVRAIVAKGNQWTNIEESTFRYYLKTISLDLSNSHVKNIKNMAFKSLVHLQNLNLSHNAIEVLYPNSLVQYENRASELLYVDLSHNNIEHISLGTFDYLVKLEKLFLNHNQIEFLEDSIFNSLKNLTHIDLQHNKIYALNTTLVNLKSLLYLDLSYNSIFKISGYELNRLNMVRQVNISYNHLEFIESNCFNQAFELNSVDFGNNKIRTEIENIMFLNNAKLNSLNFGNNNITKIQDNVFKHNSINYINFQGNNLSVAISESTFAGLKNVTQLNLYNQSITDLKENAFSPMLSLLSLNLSTNKINSVDNSSFASNNALIRLDLSYNNISKIDFLRYSLQNLTDLFLNHNKLTSLSSGLFMNQVLLKKIDVSMNNIVTIEQSSLPLKSLQYLNITGNMLRGSVKKYMFSPAKYLRFLDISNSFYHTIEKQAFVDMPVISRINMSHNIISDIDPDNFNLTNNLYSLDLSFNNITKFDLNSNSLANLKAVYLNNNQLKYFPNANLSQIVYFDLSNNVISNISVSTIQTFCNIKVLHLSHNMLKSFNNEYTNSLKDLSDLSLSSNDIYSMNLSYFKQLVSLDISNNSILSINSTFFQNQESLQSLDISKNNISAVSPGTFQNLKILKLLNMSSNNLNNLHFGSFNGLHRIQVLDLSKNKISELDVHIFHECTELQKLIIDYNQIKEIEIQKLVMIAPKLERISIGGNPIACREIVHNIKTQWQVIEVTSIDKIFHEDNVHGIKCGDINYDLSTTIPETNVYQGADSSSSFLLIWCSVITVLVIVTVGLYFYRERFILGRSFVPSRMQMRQSMDISGSEFQNDLLS